MKILAVVPFLLSGLLIKSPDNPSTTHFGVLVNRTENKSMPDAVQIKVAQELGVGYLRTRIVMSNWTGKDEALEAFQKAGIKTILNINYNAGGAGHAMPFATDFADYTRKLSDILSVYKPELVTIENEEDNQNYHTGTIDDYFAELKAAIPVVHAKGLKITNGGLTSPTLSILVYEDLLNTGRTKDAELFANKAFPEAKLKNKAVILGSPASKEKLKIGHKQIEAYKALAIDYVNFHWYLPLRGMKDEDVSRKIDPVLLDYVVAYLKKATGKQPITTEIGQLDPRPEIVSNTLKKCLELRLPYVMWYSGDGGEGKAVALQNADGSLRENGKAFRQFIKENKAGN